MSAIVFGEFEIIIARPAGDPLKSEKIKIGEGPGLASGRIVVQRWAGGRLLSEMATANVTDALLAAAEWFEAAGVAAVPVASAPPRREGVTRRWVSGHRLESRRVRNDGVFLAQCRCGWAGGVYGSQAARDEAYRAHLIEVRSRQGEA